jgi:hypothetical protein
MAANTIMILGIIAFVAVMVLTTTAAGCGGGGADISGNKDNGKGDRSN